MQARQLEAAGKALYGTRWQSDIAAALGVSSRTIRRWLAGDTPIPDGVGADIDRLLVTCINVVTAIRKRIH